MKRENGILEFPFVSFRIRPHAERPRAEVEWRIDVSYTNSGSSARPRYDPPRAKEDPMDLRGEGSERSALGFRVKSGWALAVVVSGDAHGVRARDRSRLVLADPAVPESSQPWHEGLEASGARARVIVARLVGLVEEHAARTVPELLARCDREGWSLTGAGLVVGSDADPAAIANDHIRAHAEEGRLFRRVLEAALERAGLPVTVTPEKRLYAAAAGVLGRPEARLRDQVAALGKPLEGPWRAEEKTAALAAWMALAGRHGTGRGVT